MTKQKGSGQHDLVQFVLGYLEQVGGIVEPPAYGVYEVLLPDEAAKNLSLAPYQRLTFGEVQDPKVLRLHVSHPLVEKMAESVHQTPASARVYINNVRPEKRGLGALAQTEFFFPNARLTLISNQTEQPALSIYIQYNFKAALLSDEKQEQLVSVLMDAQAGHVVTDADEIMHRAMIQPTNDFPGIQAAPMRWRPGNDLLSRQALQALLLRAQQAVTHELRDTLTALQKRAHRHLELDRARLESYYDDIATDLQKRMTRLEGGESTEEEKRRQNLEEKLAAVRLERDTKLADVEARYQVRVELELINLLLITQPKVLLPVHITNRTTTVERTIAWDPLRHRVESLVCDACGLPGRGLFLCTGGHLAHEICLAPQCIDCKRVFCQRCAHQIHQCAVCEKPVCQSSLNVCPDCKRGTCRAHVGLCHADNGVPRKMIEEKPLPELEPQTVPEPEQPPVSSPKPKPKPLPRKMTPKVAPKPVLQSAKGVRIEVQIEQGTPVITALVFKSTRQVLATRTWELTSEGIAVYCDCEKAFCPEAGKLWRPQEPEHITAQVEDLIEQLRHEYRVSSKRVLFLTMTYGHIRKWPKLLLPAVWKDANLLDKARSGFDRVASRQRRR